MRRRGSFRFAFGLAWMVVELEGCGGPEAGGAPGQAGASAVGKGGTAGVGTSVSRTGGKATIDVGTGGSGGDPCAGDNAAEKCNMVAPAGCGDGEHNQRGSDFAAAGTSMSRCLSGAAKNAHGHTRTP